MGTVGDTILLVNLLLCEPLLAAARARGRRLCEVVAFSSGIYEPLQQILDVGLTS